MKQIFSFYVILAVMASVSFIFAGRVANQDSFWSEAAQAGQAEVMLGNLALQKSQNDDVKKFAQMMIDDHTKANEQLKTLAAGKNVMLPAAINIKQRAAMDKISNLSGDDFDKEFVKIMVRDHEAAVKLFQKEADSGADPDVKSFVASTLPTLKSHWDAAKSLNDNTKSTNKKPNTTSNTNPMQ